MMNNAHATMSFDKPTLSFKMNMLTKFWCIITINYVFCHAFLKYIKLAKVAIVHVLGSMEDEQCFSSLSFLKKKASKCLRSAFVVYCGHV
jgi:hypothetical protein